MVLNSKFHQFHVKMLNSAKAGARGVNGGFNLTVESMNRDNQTESASF
jgi:hypothetical protein